MNILLGSISYTKLIASLDYDTPKMSSMVRSEEMALCQLFIQPESAYLTISELGELGVVQFNDLNPDTNYFQRKFTSEVKRCDEMERQLRYIEGELIKDGIVVPELLELPRAPLPREMLNIESRLERTMNEIVEISQNGVNLKSNYLDLCELKSVLEQSQEFFRGGQRNGRESTTSNMYNAEETQMTQNQALTSLGFVAGVIESKRMPAFEVLLWRISRGNIFLRQTMLDKPFEDPSTGQSLYKTVFVVFFQGEQLKSRVTKVCAGFHASLYNVPEAEHARRQMLKELNVQLEDLRVVLEQTRDHRSRALTVVANNFHAWTVMVRKMKAIFHTLNSFNDDVIKKCLIGECWAAVNDLDTINRALVIGATNSGSAMSSFMHTISTKETPPTLNRTNKFTQVFQNLIDVYGMASYREANPALYTIITFPFLFAIMFGDAGHGVILVLAGLWLISCEKKFEKKPPQNEIGSMFYGGRYAILLMGLFSIYTGMIYNDVFSKSTNIFGTTWLSPFKADDFYDPTSVANQSKIVNMPPKDSFTGVPYGFGQDPIWQLASNKIVVTNSYKMKTSILIGFSHMMFGIFTGIVNYTHFKTYSYYFVEFLPHVLFLTTLIGYLSFLILYKWFVFSADPANAPYTQECAPAVLITFINIFLQGKSIPADCKSFTEVYPGQTIVEPVLLIVMVLCVPVMLCGKPIVVMCQRKRAMRRVNSIELNGMSNGNTGHIDVTNDDDEEEETIGDVWIHQAIHTIEFCLNTVSHTASYLRLWALSLAHSQLSDVLWTMVLQKGLGGGGPIMSIGLYVIFMAWVAGTLSILVLMEGLSAFLHTLRLHWVEFMSKFYEGVGYKFEPFCFKTVLDATQ